MKNKLSILASLFAVTGAFYLVTTAAWSQTNHLPPMPGTHRDYHPAIHAAVRALEHARIELQNAEHDFGGHRVAALKECDSALTELKAALQYDK
jgi:hypothetical protein